jgi:hypothetical protein
MTDTVLAQIAALKAKSTAELRDMWRELFDREPTVLGRRYLEDRLAYRVQELHFGGLSDRARRKLDALADQLEPKAARRRDPGRPIAGTQLRRQWKDFEHVATVREHDFEYNGRPYKSLSAIAREITNVRWNGWTFFGLPRNGSAQMNAPPRKIRCAIYCRKSSEEGLDQAFNSLDAQREACLSYIESQCHEGWMPVDDRYDDGGFSGGTLDRPGLRRLLRDVEGGGLQVTSPTSSID